MQRYKESIECTFLSTQAKHHAHVDVQEINKQTEY